MNSQSNFLDWLFVATNNQSKSKTDPKFHQERSPAKKGEIGEKRLRRVGTRQWCEEARATSDGGRINWGLLAGALQIGEDNNEKKNFKSFFALRPC